MTVYMTKTWGFGVPSGPLQFSLSGSRDSARSILQPGDMVVIVGTMGEETAPEERGKILGLMEPSIEVVSALDYNLERRPEHNKEDGSYKWPFGLELKRAWRFNDPRTSLVELSDRKFGRAGVLGIVPLLPDEADKILALARDEIDLKRPIQAAARIEGADEARRRAAPPPTTKRTGIMHLRRAPAFTYAMALEGASQSAFKIGWAFEWKARERQFNLASIPQLNGLRYRTKLYQLWPTAMQAFQMEQAILKKFETLRHRSNSEVVTPIDLNTIQSSWLEFLGTRSARG